MADLPTKMFIHSFQWVIYRQNSLINETITVLYHVTFDCFLENICIFEEWVWNDAGIGNVYPKFKPPPSTKQIFVNFMAAAVALAVVEMEAMVAAAAFMAAVVPLVAVAAV